jgi:GNAT superfamily N-acetyltransferase
MSFTDVPAGKIAAVVTSLEMLERPAPRPVRDDPAFALQRVARPELSWFRDLFRRVGENWIWFSRLAMPDAELAAIVHHPLVEVYVLKSSAEEAGLLELDFRTPHECELSFFGLAPPFVGSGAGRWLMSRAIELAWSRPIRRLWVHTCTFDHPAALAFYVRSGFRPFRLQIELADDPRLTGLLPRTAAPHVALIEPIRPA